MTVALEESGIFLDECPARLPGNRGSRVVAVCGRDGAGKSKVCAALLELGQPSASREAAESPGFADKGRLLEEESAETRRNFSCYNHIYSQKASDAGLPKRLHLIDTPGHVDRLPLLDQALRVAHGSIFVCSVHKAVDDACGRAFAAVKRSRKPSVVFLNGVDKADDADGFQLVLDRLEQRLGIRPVVLFAPAHVSGADTGSLLLNVLDNSVCSALECTLEGGEEDKADGGLAAWAKRLRHQQIKSLAEVDNEMMEAFAEFDGEVPRILIWSALRRAAAAGKIMPLIAGSAKSGLGIDALQDAVRTFVPAMDCGPLLREIGVQPLGKIDFSPEAPFLGWVFGRRSVGTEKFLDVRILDGTLRAQQGLKVVRCTGPGEAFAPGRLLAHGPRGELLPCSMGGPGDLVLVPAPESLESVGQAGFILSDDERLFGPGRPIQFPEARTGRCTFTLKIGLLEPDERKRLLDALDVLLAEDDGLSLEVDRSTGEYRLSFMGSLHHELVRERLADDFDLTNLPLKGPRVAYHATLKGQPSAARASHGQGQLKAAQAPSVPQTAAEAWAEVELVPGDRGTGVIIEASSTVAQESIPALECGVRRGLEEAGPGGIPVTDVRVRLLGALAQREEAAALAAASAVRRAVQGAAELAVLEPIVELRVDVPSEAAAGVVEDLCRRRAEVSRDAATAGGSEVVTAHVPLREILDYAGDLKKLSDGQGFYSYQLRFYREVADSLAEHILARELASARSLQSAPGQAPTSNL